MIPLMVMNRLACSSAVIVLLCLTQITCSVPNSRSILSMDHACSIVGNLFTCYRSNTATSLNYLKNLDKYVSHEIVIREISIIESNVTTIDDEIFNLYPSLESLDLSGNKIRQFDPKIKHSALKYLNLTRNGVLDLVNLQSVFLNFPSLVTLDLGKNQINSLGKKKPVTADHNTEILLQNTNISCSADQFWFLEWVASENLKNTARFQLQESRCKSKPMEGVLVSQSLSALPAIRHPLCQTCDCFFKPNLQVNCSDRGFTSLPHYLPSQTKVVWLENNLIREMDFSPDWSSVIYLYLRNNSIESMNGMEGSTNIQNLRSLELDSNRLSEIRNHILRQLHVDHIKLSDNPWRCDCNTISLQSWIQDHAIKIPDRDRILCASPPVAGKTNGVNADVSSSSSLNHLLSGRTIYRILRSDLCPQSSEQEEVQFYDTISSILAVLTLIIICKLVYDWWWQKRTGKLPRFFKLNI